MGSSPPGQLTAPRASAAIAIGNLVKSEAHARAAFRSDGEGMVRTLAMVLASDADAVADEYTFALRNVSNHHPKESAAALVAATGSAARLLKQFNTPVRAWGSWG